MDMALLSKIFSRFTGIPTYEYVNDTYIDLGTRTLLCYFFLPLVLDKEVTKERKSSTGFTLPCSSKLFVLR